MSFADGKNLWYLSILRSDCLRRHVFKVISAWKWFSTKTALSNVWCLKTHEFYQTRHYTEYHPYNISFFTFIMSIWMCPPSPYCLIMAIISSEFVLWASKSIHWRMSSFILFWLPAFLLMAMMRFTSSPFIIDANCKRILYEIGSHPNGCLLKRFVSIRIDFSRV